MNPTGTLVGTYVLLNVDSGVLVGQSSLSYKLAVKLIETSSKGTGKSSAFVSGRNNETISVGGIASTNKESTNKGFWELRAAAIAGTAIPVTFTEYTDEDGATPASGAETLTASAIISNLQWDAPDDDKNTYSCDLQITGDSTESTNT